LMEGKEREGREKKGEEMRALPSGIHSKAAWIRHALTSLVFRRERRGIQGKGGER